MSAVERIQAAIDKLDKLKADSTPGPWHEWTNGLTDRVELWHDQEVRLWVADLGNEEPNALTDAALIVALHRTIDAQLAILRNAVGHFPQFFMSLDVELNWILKRPSSRDAVTLADAILGADS